MRIEAKIRMDVGGYGDLKGGGKAGYLLYNPSTGEIVIWCMDKSVRISAVFGPRLPSDWSLVVLSASRARSTNRS